MDLIHASKMNNLVKIDITCNSLLLYYFYLRSGIITHQYDLLTNKKILTKYKKRNYRFIHTVYIICDADDEL